MERLTGRSNSTSASGESVARASSSSSSSTIGLNGLGQTQQQHIFDHRDLSPRFDADKAREESLALDSLLGLSSAPANRSMQAPMGSSSMPPPASTIIHHPPQLVGLPRQFHAPQPQHAYQPSLGWATPSSIVEAQRKHHEQQQQQRQQQAAAATQIALATPSWTALFPSTTSQPPSSSGLFDSSPFPPPPPSQPHSNRSESSNPFPNPPSTSTSSAMFVLPPATTMYNDVNSAIASSSAAPSAFYSSYGLYQPITGGYRRFLTPSPEPSVLGDFELDLELGGNGSNGNGNGSALGTTPGSNGTGISPGTSNSNDLFDAVMSSSRTSVERNDSFESASNTTNSFAGLSTLAGAAVGASEQDPFEQLQQHMQAFGQPFSASAADDAVALDNAWREATNAAIDPTPSTSTNTSPKSNVKLELTKSGKVRKPRKAKASTSTAASIASTSPSNPIASTETSPEEAGAIASTSTSTTDTTSSRVGMKKNRNPHATQLPVNGARKGLKPEAEEGHLGPICTHCSSIATPLWRRGPDDELLCNACGLYQKLHGKSRPLAFAKQSSSAKRSSNSAAAQAAASGVAPSCHNCAATSTPMWRKDPEGNLTCNACSLYFKLHHTVRPASLAQKRKSKSSASGGVGNGGGTASTTVASTRRNSIDQSNNNSQQVSPHVSPRLSSSHALPSLAAAAAAAAAQQQQQQQSMQDQFSSLPPPAPSDWEFDPPPPSSIPPGSPLHHNNEEFAIPVTSYANVSWRAITPSDGYSSNANSRATSPEPSTSSSSHGLGVGAGVGGWNGTSRKRQRIGGNEGGLEEEKSADVTKMME